MAEGDIFEEIETGSEKRSDQRKNEILKLQDDYRAIFGTPAGVRVLFDLFEKSYIFAPFGQQNAQAYAKEGKRELGLYLLSMIGFQSNPNQLSKLTLMLQAVIK